MNITQRLLFEARVIPVAISALSHEIKGDLALRNGAEDMRIPCDYYFEAVFLNYAASCGKEPFGRVVKKFKDSPSGGYSPASRPNWRHIKQTIFDEKLFKVRRKYEQNREVIGAYYSPSGIAAEFFAEYPQIIYDVTTAQKEWRTNWEKSRR